MYEESIPWHNFCFDVSKILSWTRRVTLYKLKKHPPPSPRDEDVVSGNVVDTEPPFNLHTYSSFDMAVEASVGGYKIDYSQGPC